MKLLRLKLDAPFRSLHAGFEVHFLRDFDWKKQWDFMPYCVVGRNGSGKSNILEALAAIFYNVECTYLEYTPEGFFDEGYTEGEQYKIGTAGFNPLFGKPDEFELEYLIPVKWRQISKTWEEMGNTRFDELVAHIQIIKKKGEAPEVHCLNKELFKTNSGDSKLSRVEIKDVLPEYLIGYSSGENEILSLPFFKMRFIHYDEYEDALREETGYNQPEGRMIFLDNQFSQAIFLTNYLLQDEDILKPIYDTIGIKSIKQFRIIINQSKKIPKYRLDDNSSIEEQSLAPEFNDFFELTSQLSKAEGTDTRDLKAIDKLQHCATTQFFDNENQVLYLDYFVDEDGHLKAAFESHFDTPFELFEAFQILLTLNLYDVSIELKQDLYNSDSLYVTETVPVLASDKRIFRFKDLEIDKDHAGSAVYNKSLSDGEHQYLHAMGICLLFKDTNSLFLMDEPETHFNPDWRAKLISTLKDCFSKGEEKSILRDILITSHSPFIVSDCYQENVLVFRKDEETNKVTCERPGFKTYGASVNQINISIFDKIETIGGMAQDEIDGLYQRLEDGEEKEKLIGETDKLGDSIEKTLFLSKVKEKK